MSKIITPLVYYKTRSQEITFESMLYILVSSHHIYPLYRSHIAIYCTCFFACPIIKTGATDHDFPDGSSIAQYIVYIILLFVAIKFILPLFWALASKLNLNLLQRSPTILRAKKINVPIQLHCLPKKPL